MSLIKWSFLWSAALMFLHSGSSQFCKQMITITDKPSVGNFSLTSNCSCFYTYDGCESPQYSYYKLIGNHCLMYVSEQSPTGVCYINTSNTQQNFKVTKNNGLYEVTSDKNLIDQIILRFVRNVSTLLPSDNRNNADVCSNNTQYNATLSDVCNSLPCSQTPCTGKDARYIIRVEDNGTMECRNCCQSSTSPPTRSPPTTKTTTSSTSQVVSEVLDVIENITKSMCDDCTVTFVKESAKGIVLKNPKNASVSIGYDDNWDAVVVNETSQESKWSVTVPQEAFNTARVKLNETPYVGVVRFPELLTGLLTSVIPVFVGIVSLALGNITDKDSTLYFQSDVYVITMGVNITNLTHTIDIYFRHLSMTAANWTCMSSDTRETWTTFGCETRFINFTIQCSCTHLTFFALLMSQPNLVIPEGDVVSLTYITSIGCGLSTFFLIVGLFIHFVMWRSKTRLSTTILMHLFVALVLLNITFLSNQQITNLNNNVSCIIIAASMHFSMLATFTWFFIQALHFYLSLNATDTTKRKYRLSLIGLGWAFPAVVVIVIAALGNYEHLKSLQMCWLTNTYVHYIVNIGYYALIFIFTSMIFIVIVRKITHTRLTKNGIFKTSSKKTGAILGLFVLLGLTWGVAFFSYGPMLIPSYYIFTILNSFQGFFLFLYYYFFRNDDVDVSQSSDSSLKKTNDTSTTTTTEELKET